MNSHEYVPSGERISDDLLAYLASAPEGIHVGPNHPDRENGWKSLWEARRQNVLLAREVQEARTSLRLIAASLPPEYVSQPTEETCMDLRITEKHYAVLEHLLEGPVKVTTRTSPGWVASLHELQSAGLLCRDGADGNLWSIRKD